ncbi:MAG: virulence factor family protein, partial [Elusimicrobia bacterium]|nr:virulence factor family protein [Elusimicrobiota bacterium]
MAAAGIRVFLCAAPLWGLALLGPARGAPAAESSFAFGRFGRVAVYRPEKIEHVVLFASGEDGWNPAASGMARVLRERGALVLGVDLPRYFKSLRGARAACWQPASDFEALSRFAQKELGPPGYIRPVLAGYSSGATLVYALLAQAPPGAFRAGLSLGFCPELRTPKPLCPGSGLPHDVLPGGRGFRYGPARLSERWVVLQGLQDEACAPAAADAFVKDVLGSDIVFLDGVGHGFAAPQRWEPELARAFLRLVASDAAGGRPAAVADLPLVENPARGPRPYFAVMISGDGGWAGIDRKVASTLVAGGVPVVGLDALKYFWTPRTP